MLQDISQAVALPKQTCSSQLASSPCSLLLLHVWGNAHWCPFCSFQIYRIGRAVHTEEGKVVRNSGSTNYDPTEKTVTPLVRGRRKAGRADLIFLIGTS